MMSTLTKLFDKNIYIYYTKCIPYEHIHCEESNGIELVLDVDIFSYILCQILNRLTLKNSYTHYYILARREYMKTMILSKKKQ
jgi:hypothetical protein